MRAIGYTTPGPISRADALADIEAPAPKPGPHDLIVRVRAVSVNPVDTKVRAAATPEDGARVLGWDAAGTVVAIGEEVTLFKVGDDVFYAGALTRPGTNAELHAVDERIVAAKPGTLDFAHAAALPLTAITAWELLFDRLRVPRGAKPSGDAILIINGAGGVGSILIQLARQLTGLTVIATASRPETIYWARSLGAHHVIDHHKPLDEELARIGISEVRYVASLSGSDRQQEVLPRIIAPQGHLALIDDPESFDITGFKRKSISISWEFMFTRSMFATGDMIEQHRLLKEVALLVDKGVLRSTLTETLSPIDATNLIAAHKAVESGRAIGKTVLVAA